MSGVEDCAHLFEARHSKTVRFIDQDERGRVDDLQFPFRVLPCNVTVGWLRFRNWAVKPVVFEQGLFLVFLARRRMASNFASFSCRSGRLAKSLSVSREYFISTWIVLGALTTGGV
jgi:hypothetical protein